MLLLAGCLAPASATAEATAAVAEPHRVLVMEPTGAGGTGGDTANASASDDPVVSWGLFAAILALTGLTAGWRMRAAQEDRPLARLTSRMSAPDLQRAAIQRQNDTFFRTLRRLEHAATIPESPAWSAPEAAPAAPRTQPQALPADA